MSYNRPRIKGISGGYEITKGSYRYTVTVNLMSDVWEVRNWDEGVVREYMNLEPAIDHTLAELNLKD